MDVQTHHRIGQRFLAKLRDFLGGSRATLDLTICRPAARQPKSGMETIFSSLQVQNADESCDEPGPSPDHEDDRKSSRFAAILSTYIVEGAAQH
ncbi:hypothetical protein E4U12_002177 [Claviceps purpurea]|nr:hypothetical protein E4U12_002177 [Claviceps purpurea]